MIEIKFDKYIVHTPHLPGTEKPTLVGQLNFMIGGILLPTANNYEHR